MQLSWDSLCKLLGLSEKMPLFFHCHINVVVKLDYLSLHVCTRLHMVQRLFTAWKVMAHESRYGPVRIVLNNARCGAFLSYKLSSLYGANLQSNTLVWQQQADSSNISVNCLNSLIPLV